METHAATLAAALDRLPQYTARRVNSVILERDKTWQDAMKMIRQKARLNVREMLPAATKAQVNQAARVLPEELAMVAKLTWATAARVGDTLQVERKDVVMEERADGNWRPESISGVERR
jgi:hypothetical protein